ncbi:MAG TPA: hypothetical protein VK553_10975 [Candidatus Nitrosopolaris rasttigaisensis]|nr:hypothetical protein [Candidatus Nitrosopolaris rasttigaisensis]
MRSNFGKKREKFLVKGVVDTEGHLIETTVKTNGSFKGTPIKKDTRRFGEV